MVVDRLVPDVRFDLLQPDVRFDLLAPNLCFDLVVPHVRFDLLTPGLCAGTQLLLITARPTTLPHISQPCVAGHYHAA